MDTDKPINVVIVAAGSGSRFGSDVPKQFLDLDGVPVVVRSIQAFGTALPGCRICAVLPRAVFGHWHGIVAGYAPEAVCVPGGASRIESVRCGLEACDGDGIVLVHDGARPLVTPRVIEAVVKAVTSGCDGAIPVVPVTDSIVTVYECGWEPVDRSALRAVQTPQGFDAAKLHRAYTGELPYSLTDDASVMRHSLPDCRIALVPGSPDNIKITNPHDLALAGALLRMRSSGR